MIFQATTSGGGEFNKEMKESIECRMKGDDMFQDKKDEMEMDEMLESWETDPHGMKTTFIRLKNNLAKKKNAVLSFNSRPGITYSLRATVKDSDVTDKPLFVMVDIIDDDPANRWLSICFFRDMITDKDEFGDFVPGGLLGEDAHCFDYDNQDEILLSYIEQRIDEAHAYMSKQ